MHPRSSSSTTENLHRSGKLLQFRRSAVFFSPFHPLLPQAASSPTRGVQDRTAGHARPRQVIPGCFPPFQRRGVRAPAQKAREEPPVMCGGKRGHPAEPGEGNRSGMPSVASLKRARRVRARPGTAGTRRPAQVLTGSASVGSLSTRLPGAHLFQIEPKGLHIAAGTDAPLETAPRVVVHAPADARSGPVRPLNFRTGRRLLAGSQAGMSLPTIHVALPLLSCFVTRLAPASGAAQFDRYRMASRTRRLRSTEARQSVPPPVP